MSVKSDLVRNKWFHISDVVKGGRVQTFKSLVLWKGFLVLENWSLILKSLMS